MKKPLNCLFKLYAKELGSILFTHTDESIHSYCVTWLKIIKTGIIGILQASNLIRFIYNEIVFGFSDTRLAKIFQFSDNRIPSRSQHAHQFQVAKRCCNRDNVPRSFRFRVV